MKGRLRIDFESLLPLITLVILGLFINQAQGAPAIDDEDADGGCYYMFNHYGEGDRILTNEPCLNCTCHNSMLMCYLRVCPFTKPIGQDCTIEKKPDQCCPVINCPEEDVRIHTDQKKLLVPVSLVTPSAPSSTTPATTSLAPVSDSTELAPYERGCEMNGKYYADGAQVEGDPSKPCELCYCIRNRTACVMQECILHVEGCEPVFQPGVCCPVRYRCDYPPQITDESSSTIASVITTTIQSIFQTTPQPGGCFMNGEYYADGSRIPGAERSPCEHCYCMRGEPVCAVQECGAPLENEAGNCTAVPPPPGHCCPEKFTCGDSDSIVVSDDEPLSTPMAIISETTQVPDAPQSDDSSTDSPASQSDDPELEPVSLTTAAPIKPVDIIAETEAPVQSDQPEETPSVTVASVADDKIDSASTTSPVSESDAPGAAGIQQEDDDIVQTPTEASVPPTISPAELEPISQDQPDIPTEPSVVPGATDGPVASQDESASATSESVQVSSSTTEATDETIFGTTNQPEAIPSENLQRPSSERPSEVVSQDEPVSTTAAASSVVPSDETSASTVRPDDIPTSARPVMPDIPEIVDIGSSEEDMRPSESPLVSTERPINDAQTGPSTESIAVDVSPVESVTTEKAQVQQDEELIGTTRSPSVSESPATEPSDSGSLGDDNVSEDTVTTVAPSQPVPEQVSQDEVVPTTTSERPVNDDSQSVPSAITTQSPSSVSDVGDETTGIASDDQSSSSESSIPTTSQRPIDAEAVEPAQDAAATPGSITDDEAVVPTTQAPQREIVTELPSSSISSIDDEDVVQDEAVTTLRPESPVIVTDSPSSQVVSDEGSQDTDSGVAATTSPSAQQQQDETATLIPITSERPVETSSIGEAAAVEQQTTTRPVLPVELPDEDENEIVPDQGGDSGSSIASVTSEQPMMESSTENVIVSQPAQQDEVVTPASQQSPVEGTTVSNDGQLADDTQSQSTQAPGSQDDDVSSVGVSTQTPVESETEPSQQDSASQESGPSETEAPQVPTTTTSRPESSSPASSQDEQSQTEEPMRDATAAPEAITSPSVSDQDLPQESSQDQPDQADQDSSVSTVAPEPLPDRITTVLPPFNDESDVAPSTSSPIRDEQDAGQQADQPQTTVSPSVVAGDDQAAQVQTTQSPIDEEAGSIDQDEPVQTTPTSSAAIAADESVPVTTGRPSDLESSTEPAISQDQPEEVSPVQPAPEQSSSTQQPEVTTFAPASVESSSQQSGSTETSSNEALGDEAVTEGATTVIPPAAVDAVQADDSDAPVPTTSAPISAASQSTEPSGISSDQPVTTDQPLPASDDSSSSSTELPVVESSTSAPGAVTEAGEIIGVESVSNSPDGSESLSMMKTSTAAPLPSEGLVSSSVAPIDVGVTEDNEIVSDGSSMEGEQSSSAASVASEASSEISASTPVPSTDSDESASSSAPVSESSSSASSDDVEATTPGVAPPVNEASTEASATSQSPDLPPEEVNEIIPGAQQDSPDKIPEEPEQVSGTTLVPVGVAGAQDEVPTTVSSVSIPSSDDVSSSSQASDGISDSATTPTSVQQEGESQPGDSISSDATSSPVADEPSITTSAPVASQDDSSSGISGDAVPTTQRPAVSVDDDSAVAPAQSDDSSGIGSTDEPPAQTEPSVQDQGSSSPDSVEEGSAPITTSRPIGADSDDAQEPVTEPIPVPAQPEGGISEVIQDQESVVEQGQTTPDSADVISDIKDQVADVDGPSQGTTVQPEIGAIGVTSTIRPQQVSSDDTTELPVGVSDEPEIADQPVPTTVAPSVPQQEDESPTSPVPASDDVQAPTTASSVTVDEGETPVADAKPSEDDDQLAVTTQQPPSDSQDIKDDDQIAVTTSRPISIAEGPTTALPISDEPSVTSLPDSSPSADEPVAGTTASPAGQPSEQDQSSGDEPSAPATTLPPPSISQTTPGSISPETEIPEDSDEIRHPDDNTGDDGEGDGVLGITTAQPDTSSPVADENQTEGPAPQQDDAITTQSPVQDEPVAGPEQVSSQGTTLRPEVDIPTTPVSIVQGVSEAQADDGVTTELPSIHDDPSMITEQPVSLQPEPPLGMMSSTEKVEMDSGSSTTESSGDEEDSSTDSNVPGEGSCFVEGQTYRNGSRIPPTTACHIACACKNSIVHCLLVHCPPPPARYVDCKPIYRNGVCCPDYDCGQTDEQSPPAVTVTPEPPFADNKDDTVVTVTPEASSTPSSESLVSQQQDNSVRPTTESEIGIQDQPSEDGESSSPGSDSGSGIGTTSAPILPSDPVSITTTVLPPSESISSTDAPSQEPQHDSQQDGTEPPAAATTTPASTTTSERPSDIEQIIDSSSSAPPEMVGAGSVVAPEEDDQSSSTTGPTTAGSQYPVTTTTTVTPSSAPWPYPTSSTPPPGAMSSGACLFDGRVYMSAQQIPREDPCDFCFCFRGDIICLQQSCPPPIPGCYEEPIPGFCCPRYECPVGNGNHTTPPPLFPPSYYHNQILNNAAGGSGQSGGSGMTGSVPSGPGCEIQGEYFETGQVITSTSGPCLECRCGSTGMMECDPRECQPEPMLRKMIAAITSRRR